MWESKYRWCRCTCGSRCTYSNSLSGQCSDTPPGGQGQAQPDQPPVAPSSELSILNSDQGEEVYSELESYNDNVPEDIVELTVGSWSKRKDQISANRRRSRQQQQQEDPTYNLSTFLTAWCSNGRNAGRLAETSKVRDTSPKEWLDDN